MPAYRCEVLTADGSTARRVVEAESREDAAARMRDAGDTVLAIADPTPSLAARVISLRPWRISPPFQGRGRGWGLATYAALVERPHPDPASAPIRVNHAPGMVEGLPGAIPTRIGADAPEGEGLSGRALLLAAGLLLSIPFTTGLIATALTIRETAAAARLRREAAPGLARVAMIRAAADARPGVAAALGGRTVSDVLGHVAGALPAGATLASVARSRDGTLAMEVETGDPEALRAAFAGDPLLGRLRTTGEAVVPDRGVRVQLAGTLP